MVVESTLVFNTLMDKFVFRGYIRRPAAFGEDEKVYTSVNTTNQSDGNK
jgi:hypothetical protein